MKKIIVRQVGYLQELNQQLRVNKTYNSAMHMNCI
jgi:hypothetical protein